ncbi:uroporphyrinogen decarboxylase [Candidatus Marsarchaeota archaeon]|nr:uroporphyrinogen decarboxylase [Candidatus Marsarchaeota archaeon]MCL5404243.1 uroporphyrinogen decarboxylase [Candidatus Marsarchaeota archaeon]
MEARDSIFMRACFGKSVERHPVWFMRQAGRYLPGYNQIKNGINVLDIQANPVAASRITMLPIEMLGVDAAILYADIMIPLKASGYDVRIEESIGPVMGRLIESADELKELSQFKCEYNAPYVLKNIEAVKSALPASIPLIGFAAGPFTLLSYVFEGRPSRTFERCIGLMRNSQREWHKAMSFATEMTLGYLHSQIRAGADAVQLFDSWAGLLPKELYVKHVMPYAKLVFEGLPSNVPKIYFSSRTGGFLKEFSGLGCNAISIGSDISIGEAIEAIGDKVAIQGNLSPELAVKGGDEMVRATKDILEAAGDRYGFIFNLGHGVLKETPYQNLKQVVEIVKSTQIKARSA